MRLIIPLIVVPLFVFFISAFLAPEFKPDCVDGWVDCWHLGKLALTPLVVWGAGALYIYENRPARRNERGVVLGVLLGAIIASAWLVHGILTIRLVSRSTFFWLFVPAYVAIWYAARAAQILTSTRLGWAACLWGIGGSIPFWLVSVIWSKRVYETLPVGPSSCFVATAASRGHEFIVGPFVETPHHGMLRRANRQLVTLWQFEAFWRARAPRTHAIFRFGYNRLGPVIAAQIKSPWLADLIWLLLKPIEWTAGFVIGNKPNSNASIIH